MKAGIDEQIFWDSTPNAIHFMFDGIAERRKAEWERTQYQSWLTGNYVMHAIGASISRKVRYPKNPLEEVIVDNDMVLTEEEKDKYIEQFFGKLERMQKNFEKTHKKAD